jgi:hypothetical protein
MSLVGVLPSRETAEGGCTVTNDWILDYLYDEMGWLYEAHEQNVYEAKFTDVDPAYNKAESDQLDAKFDRVQALIEKRHTQLDKR